MFGLGHASGKSRASTPPTHLAIPDSRRVTQKSLTHWLAVMMDRGLLALGALGALPTPSAPSAPAERGECSPAAARLGGQGRPTIWNVPCPCQAQHGSDHDGEAPWANACLEPAKGPARRALLAVSPAVRDGRFFGGEVALDRVGCTPHSDVQRWGGGGGTLEWWWACVVSQWRTQAPACRAPSQACFRGHSTPDWPVRQHRHGGQRDPLAATPTEALSPAALDRFRPICPIRGIRLACKAPRPT